MKIKNWKDYLVNKDITEEKNIELEKDLQKGWLDEDGNLVLIDEFGEDYRKQFWEKYQFVFDDRVLE
jgi:hypothetical protein